MAILLSFLFFSIHSPNAQFTNNCAWGAFNLQGAQGYEIQCIDGQYAIGYTPCMAYALCQGQRHQAVYFNRANGVCEYYLAEWDDGEQAPEYSKPNNQSLWTFHYKSGEITGQCATPIQFDIIWECDPWAQPFSLETTCSIINECHHEMAIRSAYACVEGPITTTPTPSQYNDSCIWTDGDHTLDLQHIAGFILNKISDNDSSQIYSLSACSNNLNCNDEMGMITIGTISNCIQNIAKWDHGSVEPRYSHNFGGQWQFIYTNGDPCNNGPESVVTVFWNCNPFAGVGTITAAKQIGICSFEIQIDSNLACMTSE